MATTKNALAIVGGLAIGAYFIKSAADKVIANVIVTPGTPQIDNTPFASGYIKVDLPITIENKNGFGLSTEYFAGLIKYGELTLGNVSALAPMAIPAGTSRTINLDFDIPVQSVVNDVAALLQSGNIFNALLNTITLNGYLQVQGNITKVPIPLNNISIPIV